MLFFAEHQYDTQKNTVLDITPELAEHLNESSNGTWKYLPFEEILTEKLADFQWEYLFRVLKAAEISDTIAHKSAYNSLRIWVQEIIEKTE